MLVLRRESNVVLPAMEENPTKIVLTLRRPQCGHRKNYNLAKVILKRSLVSDCDLIHQFRRAVKSVRMKRRRKMLYAGGAEIREGGRVKKKI